MMRERCAPAHTKLTWLLPLAVALIVLNACSTNASKPAVSGEATPEGLTFCRVVTVIDGDTFDVSGCADAGRIRLILIDAPETFVGGMRCFGQESYEFARRTLAGRTVGLERDVSDTDTGGRYLRYAWIDGQLFNEVTVRQGYAGWNEWPPDLRYSARIRAAQDDAQAANAGLWRECGSLGAPVAGGMRAPGCESSAAEITALDKRAESVVVTGSGPLGGWYLISERGNQRYDFPADFVLDGSVVIWSGIPAFEGDPSRLWWTEQAMWNNSQSDPAALYNCDRELVSRWED